MTSPSDLTPVQRQLMLIGGQWVESESGRWLEIENPALKGTVIAAVPRADEQDVARAVDAASIAFRTWSRVPGRERGRYLTDIAALLEVRIEEIARLISTETGNALRTQARPEMTGAVDFFRYFGGVAGELKGQVIPLNENVLSYTRREPLGVVGAIIPWNAPVTLGTMKIVMALAAGNTLVLKLAEDAPLAMLEVAKSCSELLPPGVLNVLTGIGEECGAALARHPGVHKLSFTGSTEVGKLVMSEAAKRIVPVSLELGGKNPAIVFPDSDNWSTVEGVITGMRFTRQGQSCTAGSRLYLHSTIFDSFLEKVVERLSKLRVGDPLSEETDMGSLINAKQYNRVCEYIGSGTGQGSSRLLLGGLPDQQGPLGEGYFIEPTVLADVENDWRIAREEIFGPVMVAIRWDDEDDVIRMANDTNYGLAAFVWGRDIGSALSMAHRIDAGWVQVNQGGGQSAGQSYGGNKESGLGREFSLEGMLDSYTQVKAVTVNLLPPAR
jgi:acyl-CoA reductase-like NAD-dependent aldehyde dehydrogenase